MSENATSFGVVLSNVPLLNLRWEFREFHRCAHDPDFLRSPDGMPHAIRTQYFIWLGMPSAGATMMLSRSIVGMEAYLRAAAQFEGALRDTLTPKLREASANPFVLGRHAADNYFNRLPELVTAGLGLRIVDSALWETVNAFYREIRNPIFHGSELREVGHTQFAALFDILARVYEWIDSWHSPEFHGSGTTKTFTLQHKPRAT